MCRRFAEKSSFHRVKVKPVLGWLVIELLFAPNLPTKSDSHAFVNTENVVVLTVVPLPCNQLSVSISKPLAFARNARVISDIGVSFIHDLISIGIDFDAANPHVEAISGVSPEPTNPSPVRG